jgi:hypothetical protein
MHKNKRRKAVTMQTRYLTRSVAAKNRVNEDFVEEGGAIATSGSSSTPAAHTTDKFREMASRWADKE